MSLHTDYQYFDKCTPAKCRCALRSLLVSTRKDQQPNTKLNRERNLYYSYHTNAYLPCLFTAENNTRLQESDGPTWHLYVFSNVANAIRFTASLQLSLGLHIFY